MKLVKLDINIHDLIKVSELIYDTDSKACDFFFKDKEGSIRRIKKLVKAGNNSLGYDRVYVVTEDDQILGIMIYSKVNEVSRKQDYKMFFKVFNPVDAIKFLLIDIIEGIFLSDLHENDYYLACVAVDEKFRGKGIGTFILERSKELAKDEGCKRVVLDVDLENEGALRLYERIGFKVLNKKSFRWFGGEKGVINMEFLL